MPMKSFLTRTSPSLGSGSGRSVLYCKTSVPPVFSINIPFIVFAAWVDAMGRDCGKCLLTRESRESGLHNGLDILVRMKRGWEDIQLQFE